MKDHVFAGTTIALIGAVLLLFVPSVVRATTVEETLWVAGVPDPGCNDWTFDYDAIDEEHTADDEDYIWSGSAAANESWTYNTPTDTSGTLDSVKQVVRCYSSDTGVTTDSLEFGMYLYSEGSCFGGIPYGLRISPQDDYTEESVTLTTQPYDAGAWFWYMFWVQNTYFWGAEVLSVGIKKQIRISWSFLVAYSTQGEAAGQVIIIGEHSEPFHNPRHCRGMPSLRW